MPTRKKAAPTPSYAVERRTLANGLRVVLAPDRSAPVVGVAAYYDVGFRSEPEGRTGFAHLFEHLMFQGSENVGKMEHAHLVQGAGGVMNGSTRADFTNYYEALPTPALELALWLEADRMRSPRLTQDNLANQIAVVEEEIRVNVLNRPYGGFPWILMPPVLFDTFPNAHNGYGDFAELESVTLDDARDFFDRYYAPANAVLSLVGDLDVDATMQLVERHFGDIPARKAPERASFVEPALTAERRSVHTDALAPMPAVALAWHSPDPLAEPDEHLAAVVLAEVLTDGDASRLQQRLVLRDQSAVDVGAYLGLFGDPFDSRGPAMQQVVAYHPAEVGVDDVVRAVDEEIDRVATGGLTDGELARVTARLSAQLLREADQVLGRTQAFAAFELLRAQPDGFLALPAALAAVTEQQVQAAAARLQPEARAVLELQPGGAA